MLKKVIKFDDEFADPPKEIEKVFYFNFTKLEIIEKLEVEDLEGTIRALTETQDGPKAYELFKKLVLSAYGERGEDGSFNKFDPVTGAPLWRKFEASPAMSVMIIEFLQEPNLGAEFVEKCLPARLVAEAKAEAEKNPPETKESIDALVQEAARRQEDPETAVQPAQAPVAPPKWDDFTEEELLTMPQDQFQALIPRDAKQMSHEQLQIAFRRRAAQ